MAGRDYILCIDCKTKVIYDGNDTVRDRLEEIWGNPKASEWTVNIIRCPDCFNKREDEVEQLKKELEEYGKKI